MGLLSGKKSAQINARSDEIWKKGSLLHMTDKEVGELWREWLHAEEGMEKWMVEKLIRKLVEERENYLALLNGWDYTLEPWQIEEVKGEALSNFGIDPETWK